MTNSKHRSAACKRTYCTWFHRKCVRTSPRWYEQDNLNFRTGHLAHQIIERKNSCRHFERSYRKGSPPYQGADREQQASHYGKSTPSTPAIEDHHSNPQEPNERSRGITHAGIILTCVDVDVNGIRE